MDIRKYSKFLRTVIGCMSLMLLQLNSTSVNADGTETLGDATVILEEGTGIISAGIGISEGQPGNIVFNVPTGYTVVQVLLYWEGIQSNIPPYDGIGDDQITVNTIPVTGSRIMLGGTLAVDSDESSAYRADITLLGQVSAGVTNTLIINGMDFYPVSRGAGVLVIVNDNVSDLAQLAVRDGNDFAFAPYSAPQDTTVPQTFMVTPSTDARTANLELMFSSVFGTDSGGGFRPTAIDVTVGGATTTFNNLLNSVDGQEWDTISIDVPVPANETEITVQALSVYNNNDNIPAEFIPDNISGPASFHWLAAGLSIAPPPPPDSAPGRMTGGGKINDDGIWVKTSFTVHCDITLSNNIQINWKDQGNNKWHIKKPITSAACFDSPDIDQAPPVAPLDTFVGEATGKLNGKKGSILRFTFVDGGEPGRNVDRMEVSIWAPGDNPDEDAPILEVSGPLKKGNYQAHYDQPHK